MKKSLKTWFKLLFLLQFLPFPLYFVSSLSCAKVPNCKTCFLLRKYHYFLHWWPLYKQNNFLIINIKWYLQLLSIRKKVRKMPLFKGKSFTRVKLFIVISTIFEFSHQKLDTNLLENTKFHSISNLNWKIYDNFKCAKLQF